MKELPKTERPYEKLELYGEKALTNAELLAIIIKTGTKEETSIGLAQKILKLNEYEERDDLNFLREITIEEFMKIKGIGKIKAIQLRAVCELASRMNSNINYKTKKIMQSRDVANILMDKMRFEKQEILKTVILDSKNNLLKIKDVAIGSGNFATATIKSILNEAVKIEASKIILVHNHPSGDPTPSGADIEFTERVKKAAEILGIKLIDHIIIGRRNYKSIFSNMTI
jgi:DNA repair protein RadC